MSFVEWVQPTPAEQQKIVSTHRLFEDFLRATLIGEQMQGLIRFGSTATGLARFDRSVSCYSGIVARQHCN